MTIPYDATDKQCIECNRDVEDYTGHLNASEVTLCEECESCGKWEHRVDVVHRIPLKENTDEMDT